jgi:hypothetical protein
LAELVVQRLLVPYGIAYAGDVQITGPRSNAVLVSESDWRSIQETLYLSSVPGMKESIVAGLKAPDEEFSEDPGWDDAGK